MTDDSTADLTQALQAGTAPPMPPSGDYQRTLAENRAAAILAHQFPRVVEKCREDMRFACSQVSVAEEAFYVLKSERNGKPKIVTGPTIKFARTLASCWRNIHYDVVEVGRTETHSHILTYAVDLESNVRASVQNIVAHNGRRTATEIYENNASDASRRLREIVLNILPGWFVAEGEKIARATLEGEFGQARIDELLALLKSFGISPERIEDTLGRKIAAFTALDLASLVIKARTIERGDMRADDVFEPRVAEALARELSSDPHRDASLGANGARHVEPKPKRVRAKKDSHPVAGNDQDKHLAGEDGTGPTPVAERVWLRLPVQASDAARAGDDSANGPQGNASAGRKSDATAPPASIAALNSGVGRTAAEPPKEPVQAVQAPEAPVKRPRGRPPKVKPDAAQAPAKAAKAPEPPKAEAAPKKVRLDTNGAPDPNDDPENFLIHFMNRLRDLSTESEPLVGQIDTHVKKSLVGMKSLLTRWSAAVDLRQKKLARALELAKAH